MVFESNGVIMGRELRTPSEADFYHVFIRGVGRQILFEDDIDRRFFLDKLEQSRLKQQAEVLAWCLMENHVHLLVQAGLENLSFLMQRLEVAYACWFNGRHDRVGVLFQGRFGSEPISSDSQLMSVIRYIHRNPEEAGLCTVGDYPWSSYSEYLHGPCEDGRGWVLGIFGGSDAFERFHRERHDGDRFMEDACYRGSAAAARRFSDDEALQVGESLLGGGWRADIAKLPKADRDAALAKLRDAGLRIRQIERLTGIGRGIIANAGG